VPEKGNGCEYENSEARLNETLTRKRAQTREEHPAISQALGDLSKPYDCAQQEAALAREDNFTLSARP